jgi:hypothetical protein
MNANAEFPMTDGIEGIEKQVKAYFSCFKAEPEFKHTLYTQLKHEIEPASAKTKRRIVSRNLFTRPMPKWVIGILAFAVICLLSIFFRPVRQAFGKAFDLGYLEGIGFVRISETNILNGTVAVDQGSQVIVVDQIVMNTGNVTVWLHATGEPRLFISTSDKSFIYLEAEGQQYPANSWGWADDDQSGVFRFSVSSPSLPLAFSLHLTPEWNIPLQLIPMSESKDHQAVTLFSDLCETHKDVELCVQAFSSDSTGYHLLLKATSLSPDFYLDSLYLTNSLAGKDVQLMDSSGNLLQYSSISSRSFISPFEIPVEEIDGQREASTTLHFLPVSKDNNSLTLTAPGLQVKTPVDQIIICNVGNDPVIGSSIPCEISINIGGVELTFHSIEVVQGQTGTQLRMISDPIQPKDSLMITGAFLENLNKGNYLIGTSFEVKTRQLILFLEQDTFNADLPFNIRIVDGYLTILEPYQFNWLVNP